MIASKKWPLIGLVLLIMATLVMGWFVGQFFPGTPRSAAQDTITAQHPGRYNTGIEARENIPIRKGDSLLIEGVTQGAAYTYKNAPKSNEVEYGSFEMSILDAKVISGESYRELYPDFPMPDRSTEPRFFGSELPGKCFLVRILVSNPSDSESVNLPELVLWSDHFNLRQDFMGSGAYSFSPVNEDPNFLEDFTETRDWSYDLGGELAPGKSREIVIPYYVYKNSFKDDLAFEEIDLSDYGIDLNDYKQRIRYRFWLA